jgi:aryl carrier-like protein
MIPAAFLFLDALPLSANGKVDRNALPKEDLATRGRDQYVAPRTEIERQLAEIWQSLLGRERVGIYDNFFEFGGHSLLVMSLLERLRRLGLTIEARTVFVAPVLADLAAAIEAAVPPVDVASIAAEEDLESDDTEVVVL